MRKRKNIPMKKWTLWIPEAVLDRLRKVAREKGLAEGRRVSISSLIVGAAKRSYRRKR